MSEDRVLIQREGRIAVLTMNEPERMNPFSPEVRNGLIAHLEALQTDDSCRAVVLTGAGDHFTAGGDIRSFQETNAMDMRNRLALGSTRLVKLMAQGTKPIVCAAQGNCYGAGMSLGAACDHFVVDPNTVMSCAFIRLGFVPDLGLMWSLPKRIGMGKAKELTMLATRIDGAEAVRLGIADRLSKPGKALEEALVMAEKFAVMPPISIAMLKGFFAEDLDDVLKDEIHYQPILTETEDHAEAKRAFFEKRPPVFTGR